MDAYLSIGPIITVGLVLIGFLAQVGASNNLALHSQYLLSTWTLPGESKTPKNINRFENMVTGIFMAFAVINTAAWIYCLMMFSVSA